MELTAAKMNQLFIAYNALLQKGFEIAWTDWTKFCTVITSSTALERYPMTIIEGSMREWVGERVVNEIAGKTIDVKNRDFEYTQGVNRNDIEDDNIGFYQSLFTEMGYNAASLWPQLVADILKSPGKWADGNPFFGNRKIGKATINNTIADALTAANYEAAREQMMNFHKADGKNPIGLIPDTLMVGPSLEKTVKRILKAEIVAEGGVAVSNINADECDILVNPYMTGALASKWYLMCTKRGVKPVIIQKRKEGALQRWDKDADECVKSKNRNEYGLHYRGEGALLVPQLIIEGASA